MASQLSKKAALPLAKILATCRNNVSNTGPRNGLSFASIQHIRHNFFEPISLQWRHNGRDGVSVVCSTVCSGADERKHQSSASLAFMRGIHQWPVGSHLKGPVTRKGFHLMTSPCRKASGDVPWVSILWLLTQIYTVLRIGQWPY